MSGKIKLTWDEFGVISTGYSALEMRVGLHALKGVFDITEEGLEVKETAFPGYHQVIQRRLARIETFRKLDAARSTLQALKPPVVEGMDDDVEVKTTVEPEEEKCNEKEEETPVDVAVQTIDFSSDADLVDLPELVEWEDPFYPGKDLALQLEEKVSHEVVDDESVELENNIYPAVILNAFEERNKEIHIRPKSGWPEPLLEPVTEHELLTEFLRKVSDSVLCVVVGSQQEFDIAIGACVLRKEWRYDRSLLPWILVSGFVPNIGVFADKCIVLPKTCSDPEPICVIGDLDRDDNLGIKRRIFLPDAKERRGIAHPNTDVRISRRGDLVSPYSLYVEVSAGILFDLRKEELKLDRGCRDRPNTRKLTQHIFGEPWKKFDVNFSISCNEYKYADSGPWKQIETEAEVWKPIKRRYCNLVDAMRMRKRSQWCLERNEEDKISDIFVLTKGGHGVVTCKGKCYMIDRMMQGHYPIPGPMTAEGYWDRGQFKLVDFRQYGNFIPSLESLYDLARFFGLRVGEWKEKDHNDNWDDVVRIMPDPLVQPAEMLGSVGFSHRCVKVQGKMLKKLKVPFEYAPILDDETWYDFDRASGACRHSGYNLPRYNVRMGPLEQDGMAGYKDLLAPDKWLVTLKSLMVVKVKVPKNIAQFLETLEKNGERGRFMCRTLLRAICAQRCYTNELFPRGSLSELSRLTNSRQYVDLMIDFTYSHWEVYRTLFGRQELEGRNREDIEKKRRTFHI